MDRIEFEAIFAKFVGNNPNNKFDLFKTAPVNPKQSWKDVHLGVDLPEGILGFYKPNETPQPVFAIADIISLKIAEMNSANLEIKIPGYTFLACNTP